MLDTGLVECWRRGGVEADFIHRMEPLVGRRYSGGEFVTALDGLFGAGEGARAWSAATYLRGVPGRRLEVEGIRGFDAEGSLGQYFVVLPAERVLVVRQRRRSEGHRREDDFAELTRLVMELFGRTP